LSFDCTLRRLALASASSRAVNSDGGWSTGVVSQQMDTSSIRFSSYTKPLHWRIGWSASVFLRVSRRFFPWRCVTVPGAATRQASLNRPETRANKLQQQPTTQTTTGKELYTTQVPGSRVQDVSGTQRISQEFDMFLRC
jgi:hypothetical protein